MTRHATAGGMRPQLTVIDGGVPPEVDTVIRLREFRAEHPEVNIIETTYRHVAEIPAGTVPGDSREMVISDPALGDFMNKLDRLFPPADKDLLKTCGTLSLPRPEGGRGAPRDGCARRLRGI